MMEEDDIYVIPPDAYQRIEEEIDELTAEHAEQVGRTRQSTGTSEPSLPVPLVQRDTSFTRGARIPYELNSSSSISSGARAQGLNLIAEAAMHQRANQRRTTTGPIVGRYHSIFGRWNSSSCSEGYIFYQRSQNTI